MAAKLHQWKIGTINIRTGKDDEKLENAVRQINKAGISICGLQEVRRLRTGSAIIKTEVDGIMSKYEVYWSGNTVKRQHGVGIAVKVENGIDIVEVTPVNARIIVLDIVVYGCALRVINCYAPTENDSDAAKTAFYHTLGKQFNRNSKQKTVVLGDFNATTSAAWYNSSLRENIVIADLETNNNGERFHFFFNIYSLSVLNTWFSHKRSRRITWHSADGQTKKVYDFILSCSWLRQYVSNCRVYNSYNFDSDHRLVVAHLNTPCTKVARYINRPLKQEKKYLDLSSLNDPIIENNFINAAVENIQTLPIGDNNNNEINDYLVKSINTAGTDTIPQKEKTKLHQPWHNDEGMRELYDLRDKQRAENFGSKLIAATTKKIRKRARYLRNQHFKAEAEKINQHAISRELDKLFFRAKNQETTLKPAPEACPPEKNFETLQNTL